MEPSDQLGNFGKQMTMELTKLSLEKPDPDVHWKVQYRNGILRLIRIPPKDKDTNDNLDERKPNEEKRSKIGDIVLRPMPCRRNDKCTCVEPCKMKPIHNVIEPMFDSEEYAEYMENVPILKRISVGFFSWAGDGVPNDAHFWGKQDFLTDPQFQGDSEINYFRKTNTDLVTFLQTEGWLCLVRIRKVLRMLNDLSNYDDTIDSLSKKAGFPVDSWGNVFEKMHPHNCKCAPCSALREVKKQLEKKSITSQEVTQSVIHHIRRCVYRVLISGIDRIFETFCSRRFSVVWFILAEEFDDHYRDTEFEKLCSLIMNDIVAIEPFISLSNFSRMILELYEGATDLARAVLHKFAVILGSQKMFYTTSMNFIMFYIDSFNMIIRMLRWLENKFRVFNQLANGISAKNREDKLDFKSLILHAMYELVYNQPDVVNRREAALKVIAAYQKLQNSYFGPHIENLEKYLDYIHKTLQEASAVFQAAKLPCKCPIFKVPTRNVIDASLYINPYRDDQFDAPQVFHCYWQDRFIIERSQTPWKILYNNKAKILLRLTVENPADKNKKLAINVFLAEENPTAEDRIKDQYFALYESRLERLVDFFDVLKQEVIEYYANTNSTMGFFEKLSRYSRKAAKSGKKSNSLSKAAMCRRINANSNVTKISVPVKIKRPDKRSRYSKDNRMAILSSLMQKHRKSKKPSTIENLEQLLTFAVKTGVEGAGMLPELTGEAKDVYVSITSVDKARRAKADQEFSLHELMSFIIFWYARHGCVTEFEGHTLHRTTFGCTKSSFKESFPLLYRAAEELDAAVGEGLLSDNDLAILEKGLSNSMTEEEIKRCKKGLERTLYIKREFNELIQSKRAFAKIASTGFCVTLSGPADGPAVLTTETDAKKMERKKQAMTKVPEIRNRMRKALEGRHNDVVVTPKGPTPKGQQKLVVEEVKVTAVAGAAAVVAGAAGCSTPQSTEDESKEIDVDELVQLIEGTHIKNDPNPKKAAKKARQKERKEQERQRQAEEQAKEEEARRTEEIRKQEEEKNKVEMEKKKKAADEQRRKEELQRKQKEVAMQKKEEQRRKKEEFERRKAEEKRLKKEAKKQRREQRKKEHEVVVAKEGNDKKPSESPKKTDTTAVGGKPDGDKKTLEKEYGRLKHEKEQRKREEEEARRMQQLRELERAQASKKNKKKKKKQKSSTDIENASEPAPGASAEDGKAGQPLLEILNTAAGGSETQVYPTNMDGKLRSDEALPLQNTVFIKADSNKMAAPGPNVAITASNGEVVGNLSSLKNMNPQPHNSKQNLGAPPMYPRESSNLTEIDLSQLKLPPGITITKVPQNANGPKFENVHSHAHSNGFHTGPESHAKPILPTVSEYQRSPSMGGFNSNVMVVDSRCPSMESPHIGGRTSDMMYGANGTRPSSETSIASDRPSSGMDCLSNNGPSPYIGRVGYPGAEGFGKRVPVSMSSPFATSRNETPSPAWQTDMHPGMSGMGGMLPHNSTPDRHGFWSPSPASPVTFPPNSVTESYIRAQDQQFIKPRPQTRGGYFDHGKGPSPSLFGADNSVSFIRKAPVPEFRPIRSMASSSSSFDHPSMPVAKSPSTSAIGPIGYNLTVEMPVSQPRATEQWTPWSSNGERFSPEVSSTTPSMFAQASPFSVDDLNDPNDLWESDAYEKLNANRTVNPYGPIGSNISRRPSNAATNGHGKINEAPSAAVDAAFWLYNRTF